jgi:GDPmannose 4,6-dehydratase
MVGIYRRTFGLFACNGIMFNHESPRRGEHFVTRKICQAAAAIKLGREQHLLLGDTNTRRDWGHARDYVRAMWLMLQQARPDDYVIATGELHSVQEVVEIAFAAVQLDWRAWLKHEERLLRPAEPLGLVGNAAKARQVLDWQPQTTFTALIQEMTRAELAGLGAAA